MDIINSLNDNYHKIQNYFHQLTNENDNLKKELVVLKHKYDELETDYKQFQNVSIHKSLYKQIDDLKSRNDILEKQLAKYKIKETKEVTETPETLPEKDFNEISYKKNTYLLDPVTNDIYEDNDGNPGELVAKLVNGKFKKL